MVAGPARFSGNISVIRRATPAEFAESFRDSEKQDGRERVNFPRNPFHFPPTWRINRHAETAININGRAIMGPRLDSSSLEQYPSPEAGKRRRGASFVRSMSTNPSICRADHFFHPRKASLHELAANTLARYRTPSSRSPILFREMFALNFIERAPLVLRRFIVRQRTPLAARSDIDGLIRRSHWNRSKREERE